MHGNMLKQNADKTEVIVFTSERNSRLVSEISVTVGGSNIPRVSEIWVHGMIPGWTWSGM